MTLSERIDRVVTHRYLGIPIFLTILYFIFYEAGCQLCPLHECCVPGTVEQKLSMLPPEAVRMHSE